MRQALLFATTITACGGGGAPPPMTVPISVSVASVDASATQRADGGGGAGGDVAVPASTAPRACPCSDGDNGATVAVTVGQALVVTVQANPTTGYTWSVIHAPLELGSPQIDMLPPSSDADGAPARQRFSWTPRSPLPRGEHSLVLGYRRSFERETAPLKTFRLTLRSAAP